jgi:predicted ATPase/class 3 adenylate cyclase
MQCPQCRRENPPQAKFCRGCGSRFAPRCGQCGIELAADDQFCMECGTPVAAPAPQPTPAPLASSAPASYTPTHLAERIISSRGALEGERKQVTVLFADLKGSMELLADRDPEEARAILDPVLERMMEAVHRYEGTVNQVMGDGIMALFGAPLAHEDHAVRACYAALRMQETVKQYAREVQRTHGLPLHIRVGLNSGEVVVRSIGSDLRMDYTAVGQSTHLAARMEQMGMPGSILLAPNTLQLAEGYVQVRALGPMVVKGLSEPIEVYELTGAGTARSRLQAAAARGLTMFVGRDAELETLRRTLDQAGAGHGQVVALVGEPGVGKSRLVWEFGHSHRTQGWVVLESGSVSYGKATSYLPLIDLLKSYCGIESQDDHRRIREKVLGKLLALDRALETTLPAFLALLDVPVEDPSWNALDPPQRRSRTLDALKRLLLRESQVQPLLLVCEDLHWIDAETQALLDSLVDSLPAARLLLLVNYRPEYEHTWHRKTYYQQLRLDPLPPASAEALLDALLGDAAELQPLKRLLITRTEGNPFFVEESVRTLVESGTLIGERGEYRLARRFESTQVPATVQAVLAARIDRLAPEDKRLLQSAAVIGKDVPYSLLQAIAELPEDALQQGLARLHAAEFLYETSLFPELEYTFKHALTHEVTYGSVLQDRRRALHARVVRAIESLFRDRLDEHAERLAHHALAGQTWDKAVQYFRHAGAKAVARSANREAVSYFEQALVALEQMPEEPEKVQHAIGIRLDLGPALMLTRGVRAPEVDEVYSAARALCVQAGDTQQLFAALWGLWFSNTGRREFERAWELAEELYAIAERSQDTALLLEAHHALWAASFGRGDFLTSRDHARRGRALYDPQQHRHHARRYGGHDAGVCCRGHLALALWRLGYPDQALHSGQEALALAQEIDHPQSLLYAHFWAAFVHHQRGESELATERASSAVAWAIKRGLEQGVAGANMLRTLVSAEPGDGLQDLLARSSEVPTMVTALTGGMDGTVIGALLADLCLRMGHAQEGLAVIAEVLATARHDRRHHYEAEILRIRGDLLLAQATQMDAQAEQCLQEALTVARRQDAKSFELRAATSLARLWQRQGKRDDAHRLVADVYGWFTEGFDTQAVREARALIEDLT